MEDEMLRAFSARLLATSTVAEALLAITIAEKPAIREPLRNMLLNTNPVSVLGDGAAAWWADVEVRRREHIERMLSTADALLAFDTPPPPPEAPPP